MKKPLFLTMVVAASIGAGVLADRNWLHSVVEEGAQCDFVRPATAKPAITNPAVPCPGQAGCLGMNANGRIVPQDAPIGDDHRTILIALGGLLGLLGLGAAWRQATREPSGRRSRGSRIAALAPVAAFADPAVLRDPAPPHRADDGDPVTGADPSDNPAPAASAGRFALSQQRRRGAATARWRRLGWFLLFGGSVAAVAASTSRGLWFDQAEPAARVEPVRATAMTHVPSPPREPDGWHLTPAPPPRGDTHDGGQTGAPLPFARDGFLDGHGGASRGTIADSSHARLAVGREPGDRLGAHLFDGRGGGTHIVTDPGKRDVDDRLTKPGGGDQGAGGSRGGDHDDNEHGRGDPDGANTGGAKDGGKTGGSNDDNGGHEGGKDSHDGGSGGDPGNWLGNDPGHGGSTEVPEPDAIGLLALGIVGLAMSRSRRLRQRLKLEPPAR